ncbi:hypothetical protein C1H46_034270 [Malus baccata]|uniref:Uncharacterized protein n=1 Tax=Malus baccata TaxID=106549 RepID=A0A540L0Y9_MALBA|nr:hypothetical protein C1H46_034270 [Malus baccata]
MREKRKGGEREDREKVKRAQISEDAAIPAKPCFRRWPHQPLTLHSSSTAW